ncbi:MAG: SulP family inorganic anion transporter [Lysobacterales bacterium]
MPERSYRRQLTPALVSSWAELRQSWPRDLLAGLTVAIVALPLAMALAIASGATPDKGLLTAVVAGFLISTLGGSRVQIGGPTGAFIPVVFLVIQQHGYDGLILATLLAGVILILAGLLRVGALMRYMPRPVITGFTAGIAVIIFCSQLKDFFGLQTGALPAEFLPRMAGLLAAAPSWQPLTVGLGLAALVLIVLLRRHAPRWPAFLLAVLLLTLLNPFLPTPAETLGQRFGEIRFALPAPHWPAVSLARLVELLPAALTIAFLAGIESLLSAVVADGMTGGRHRPNAELLAQGVANGASALFGGLPATGAIARTATNVRAGALTPLAGIVHAVFVLAAMLLLGPWLAHVPLVALAAVLVIVAWNMSEHEHFRHLLRAPLGDRIILLLSFGLTVLVDLTVAIQTGLVVAAFVFMHRMAQTVEVAAHGDEDDPDLAAIAADQRERLPPGVEAFRVRGPLFFGATSSLEEVPRQFMQPPRVFILRMGQVPLIDASGAHALAGFLEHWARLDTPVIISGLRPDLRRMLARLGIVETPERLHFVADFEAALRLADESMQ